MQLPLVQMVGSGTALDAAGAATATDLRSRLDPGSHGLQAAAAAA